MRPTVIIILAVLIAALWAFDTYEYDGHYGQDVLEPLSLAPGLAGRLLPAQIYPPLVRLQQRYSLDRPDRGHDAGGAAAPDLGLKAARLNVLRPRFAVQSF